MPEKIEGVSPNLAFLNTYSNYMFWSRWMLWIGFSVRTCNLAVIKIRVHKVDTSEYIIN